MFRWLKRLFSASPKGTTHAKTQVKSQAASPGPSIEAPQVPQYKTESLVQAETTTKRTGHKKRTVYVTVGLDFGTSSSKCVINLEEYDNHEDRFLAVAFPLQSTPGTTLCIPTSIGVENHCLVFGELADHLPEDQVIRSFKMAIPCMDRNWGNYRTAFMMPQRPGYFDIEGHPFSALDLGVLYVANIIRQVKIQLRRYLSAESGVQVYLNLAAPLNQLKHSDTALQAKDELTLRDSRLSQHYIALGQRSLRLGEQSQNPWPIQEARSTLMKINGEPLLAYQDSPAYVVPETLAAITNYIHRPRTRPNHFMTFDVGAGSTDASIFWLCKKDGEVQPWYYDSASLHLGMDAIDYILRSVTETYPGGSDRERRENYQLQNGGLKAHRELCEGVLKEIRKHRRMTFGRSYDKEKNLARWGDSDRSSLTVLLIGGGSQTDIIKEIVRQSLWKGFVGDPDIEPLDLDLDTVLMPDGHERQLVEYPHLIAQSSLLIIAQGLAKKIADIPEYGEETEPLICPQMTPAEDRVADHWW